MDREKVISTLEEIKTQTAEIGLDSAVIAHKFIDEILTLLKAQEVRELTMDEWQEWKNNPKRNPICELWEHDTSPIWVLNPDTIHEPALLMGKLKLFTGKPTFEQCKAVKWSENRRMGI